MPPLRLTLGYRLRAALDGCVYAAAVVDSGENPPPKGRDLRTIEKHLLGPLTMHCHAAWHAHTFEE